MPADPLHNPTVRRANRKNDEDLEVRRARGEISCAECRRLKLRCDKKIPCSSCTRRGCPSICPNGSLATGQGARFTMSDAGQLQTRVAEMGTRIRQLEDALAVLQSTVSPEVHPLLKEDLLAIKNGSTSGMPSGQRPVSAQAVSLDPVIDSLGSLSIGDRGEGKYFGRSAGAEMLLMAGAEADRFQDSDLEQPAADRLPEDVSSIELTFPFPQHYDAEIPWDLCFKYLPAEPRAWTLCETFIEHGTWKFRPICREQLVDELLTPIYKAVKDHAVTGVYRTEELSAHQFAALYLVFAIGALMDLTLDAFNNEAHLYYHMGAGCISMRSMFDSQDIITVQALLLLGQYKGLGGRRYTMDATWYLTALSAKLAQGLGLHRDSARFRMDPKMVNRRRSLFWELFCLDHYASLSLGRPVSIRLADTDCEFPEDDEAVVDEQGNTLVGYYRWKYEFVKEAFSRVTEQTLTANAPSYQTILELDRKLREFTIPPHLNAFTDPKEEGYSLLRYMKRSLLGQYRSATLLYLHRSFCVKAMVDHAKNPLQSPYAPSYLAAYRCASGVVRMTADHYERFPDICQRLWSIWTNLFNAAVVLGAIVCRSPTSSIAPTAFIELGLGCDLFEKGSLKGVLQCEKARSAMAILRTLRSKALRAYSSVRAGPGLLETQGPPPTEEIEHDFDELALFGGQTRILVCRWLQTSKRRSALRAPVTSVSPSSGSSETDSSSPTQALATPSDDFNEIHPSLLEYISTFAPLDPSIADFGSIWDSTNQSLAGQLPLPVDPEIPSGTSMAGWSNPSVSLSMGLPLPNSKLSTATSVLPQPEIPRHGFFADGVGGIPSDSTYMPASVAGQAGINTQWNAFLEASGLIQMPNNDADMINDRNPFPSTSFDFTETHAPLQGFY